MPIPQEPPPEYDSITRDEFVENSNFRPHPQSEDETESIGRQRDCATSPPGYIAISNCDKAIAGLTWRPSYLRRGVLLGFISFFLAVLGSIEVIYQVSEKRHGLASTRESWHYLWKFGPTAGKPVANALSRALKSWL